MWSQHIVQPANPVPQLKPFDRIRQELSDSVAVCRQIESGQVQGDMLVRMLTASGGSLVCKLSSIPALAAESDAESLRKCCQQCYKAFGTTLPTSWCGVCVTSTADSPSSSIHQLSLPARMVLWRPKTSRRTYFSQLKQSCGVLTDRAGPFSAARTRTLFGNMA